MKNTNQKFNTLFDLTNEHLKEKKYLYKPVAKKNGVIQLDENGNEKYNNPTPHKITLLTQAFNIALENYKNIRAPYTGGAILKDTDVSTDILIRYYNNKHYKIIEEDDKTKKNVTLIDDKQNYTYKIFKDFREIEHKLYKTLISLRNYHSHYIHEPGVLTFEDFFNIEELSKTDKTKVKKKLSNDEYNDAKLWFKKRFDDTKTHLIGSLNNRKILLEEKLEKETNNKSVKDLEVKIKSIKRAYGYLHYNLSFYNNDNTTLSLDAQLFIAMMFLTKRQANIILDKWRKVKDLQNYELTKKTFYTYFCIKESYSLNNYNDNLMKFRDITAKLSNMPKSENDNLKEINLKIDKLNEGLYKELDNSADVSKLKGKITKNEKLILKNSFYNDNAKQKTKNELKRDYKKLLKIEELKKQLIPLRKTNIFTSVLMQYMVDNNLFKDTFEIAINKNPIDRLNYIKNAPELELDKNLTDLKDRIKELKKDKTKSNEREILKKHFKELKRNFVFKTTAEIQKIIKSNVFTEKTASEKIENKDFVEQDGKTYTITKELRYSIKKKNALVRYKHPKIDRPINIILSPQLLLKWVFTHLIKGNNVKNKIVDIIINHIDKQVEQLTNTNNSIESIVDNYKGEILISKVFPTSYLRIAQGVKENSKDRIESYINTKVGELEHFLNNNKLEKKPWKYASNKKIKTIFSYMQFRLLKYTYVEKHYKEINKYDTIDTFIRHNSFNIHTYDTAREYFRFFGRYKKREWTDDVTPINLVKVDKLRKEYRLIFSFLNIIDANSLEDLFNNTIEKYITDLKTIDITQKDKLKHVFKIKKAYNADNKEDIEKNIKNLIKDNHYIKSIAIHPDIIDLKELMHQDYQKFKTEKEKPNKPFRFSEYAFIRQLLTNTDLDKEKNKSLINTNIDFIFQKIIPKIGWDRVPSPTMRQLLKIKTEELILWNIAKHYWGKANEGKEYNLFKLKGIENSSSFQEFTSFNKVYQRDLEYTIKIPKKFWTKNENQNQTKFQDFHKEYKDKLNEEVTIKLKIPAKKYDNKFLGYESSLITEFCLFNYKKLGGLTSNNKIALPNKFIYNDRKYNLQVYEDLLKVINSELKKSIGFVSNLLIAEKRLLESGPQKYKDRLTELFQKENPLTGYYLSFSDQLINDLINKEILKGETDETVINYITNFRNNALHYQLQDPKRMKIINKHLKKYIGNINYVNNNEITLTE